MKYLFVCLTIVIAMSAWVRPAQASFILHKSNTLGLTNGLVGWWTFDGKDISGVQTYDRSGNGNRGIMTSGVAPALGKIGQSIRIDGVGDHEVDVQNGSNQVIPAGNAAFTISLWLNPEAPTTSALMTIMMNETYQNSGFRYAWDIPNDSGLCGAGRLYFWSGESGGSLEACSTTVIKPGQWYHAVIVYTGSGVDLYVNGSKEGSDTSGTVVSNTNDIKIGGLIGGKLNYKGNFDDVRIYNRALTADEIKRLYNLGGTVKLNSSQNLNNNNSLQNGLVGWWTFDGKDMAVNRAFDKSGTGNYGTLTGGPTRAIGKIGQGLQLDGVDDYVNVPVTSSLKPAEITVCTWAKRIGLGDAQTYQGLFIGETWDDSGFNLLLNWLRVLRIDLSS